MRDSKNLKSIHVITKTITQVFLYFLEIIVISGLLSYISFRLNNSSDTVKTIDCIERFMLFYAVYQLAVYAILNNINDARADEYLALRTAAERAIIICDMRSEHDQRSVQVESELIKKVDIQLDGGTFNDVKVRRFYEQLKEHLKNGDISALRLISVDADHQYELSKLSWRYSFLLRLIK